MSQLPVAHGALVYVSKEGRCICCGRKRSQCSVCQEWFSAGRSDNEICSSRCRTRRHRQKIRDELELDDE